MAKHSRQPDQEQQRRALALYATGLTIPEVGARLGIGAKRVGRMLRAAGVTPRQGFAALSPKRQRQIAARGGQAAHARGTAHEFTHEEAVAAGAKGGTRAHELGRAHAYTPEGARAAGRQGGRALAAKAKARVRAKAAGKTRAHRGEG
jgi:hypothetical protein